jgi:hypothetical protein
MFTLPVSLSCYESLSVAMSDAELGGVDGGWAPEQRTVRAMPKRSENY